MISFVEIRSSKTLRRMKNYLLLEVETTGPDPELDSIIELGMLRVTDGQIANRASTRINPETPIPPEATEATGISNADVAGALSYAQIAPSIAKLLLGEVVVARPAALQFVRTLLEECEFSGEIRTVDLESFAQKLLPGLEAHDLDSLSAYFEVAPQAPPRVLGDCARRYAVLQGCRRIWEEQAAEREAAKGTQSRSLFAGITPAKSRRGRKAVKDKPLSTWEIVESVAAVLLLLAGLLRMMTAASVFLLLAAAVICPFRPLRRRLGQIGVPVWAPIALCAVLIAGAVVFWPREKPVKEQSAELTPPPYIMLTWNELGSYGEEVVVDPDAAEPVSEIRFRLPPGRYRVLNANSPNAATITVHGDDEEQEELEELDVEMEAEVEEAVLFRRNGAFTILGNKGQEIYLDKDQYLTLSEKAEKVMFQYLGPLPTPAVKEGEDPENPKPKEPDVYAYINGKEVRMRRSPSVDAYIMTTYDTGTQVKVLGVDGDWTRVKVDNRLGYIFTKYLSETNPLEPQESPAPSESPAPQESPAPSESPAPADEAKPQT